MNSALKGALLSGVVFPGLGQVMLKHYARGLALMLAILASLALIVATAVQQALSIIKKLDVQGGSIDITAIINAANQASAASESRLYNALLVLIVFCWIAGVVDAYRIGKRMDQARQSARQAVDIQDT